MMRKLLFFFTLILGCLLASCHKDSNFEGREPSVLNDTVEVYAERAVFRWEVDYPGKIGSVVELGTDKEFSDGERYGEEQVINKKQFEVEVDSLADGKSYYYRYVVWNRFDTFKTEAKRFTTTALLVPTVETDSITEVSYTSAVCHGEVSADGGAEVTSRGFCYALHENPTMADSVLLCGEGMGAFEGTLTGLAEDTRYYVKAFATNRVGTVYGSQKTFTTLLTVNLPEVTTLEVTNITQTTATGGGNVTSSGNADVTERGICWSTSHNPTTSGNHASSGTGTGSYTVNMTGLTAGTTYYVRAYAKAKNSSDPVYGSVESFTTLQNEIVPTVITTEITNITQTTATGGGNVTSSGNSEVTERGICWSTSHNPTTSGSHASSGTGTGSYTVNMTGLTAGTTYYVRAYAKAKNSSDPVYGSEESFTTLQNEIVPTVITTEITNITQTTATGGGNVTSSGNSEVTERGICWSTSPNPTTSGSHASSGSGTGSFTVNMTGLTPNTIYYVRAYAKAKNSADPVYGSEESFTTLPKVTTSNVTNITQTSATGGGNVTATGNADVTERGICWSKSHNPTTSGTHASSGTGTGGFTVNMTLTANTTYYVRAYAKNSTGTAYGSEVSFITLPMVTTSNVTNIKQTSATGGGYVSATGNATVTERGICWSTNHNPTTSGSHASVGSGTGSYTVNMTGLTVSTTYYVRAYAKNSSGTGYGSELSFTTLAEPTTPTGAIDGLFSVSATQQVYFSQGNLQYRASTNTWRFAEHQWDYVGDANSNISQTYSGWIDLFGWGTSGYNHGAVCYQPWSTSKTSSDYYAYGSYTYNLYDQTGQADWGYNAISNGGNTTHTWRTLTHEEWGYVFNTRNTSSGIRYAKARVNNVNGVILLPDDWQSSYYSLSSTNSSGASFSSNTITATQWATLEQHGAVFLPAAGYRDGTPVLYVGSYGFYWSASCRQSYYAWYVGFDDSRLYTGDYGSRSDGISVRLVLSPQ